MEKCIVLLSGGLDSTVNLLLAQRSYDVVSTLTFDYGQRAAAREIQSARSLSDRLGIRHILVPLLFFKEFTTTSLVSQKMDIPSYEDVDIQSVEKSFKSAEKVWVPNRNGIFKCSCWFC